MKELLKFRDTNGREYVQRHGRLFRLDCYVQKPWTDERRKRASEAAKARSIQHMNRDLQMVWRALKSTEMELDRLQQWYADLKLTDRVMRRLEKG